MFEPMSERQNWCYFAWGILNIRKTLDLLNITFTTFPDMTKHTLVGPTMFHGSIVSLVHCCAADLQACRKVSTASVENVQGVGLSTLAEICHLWFLHQVRSWMGYCNSTQSPNPKLTDSPMVWEMTAFFVGTLHPLYQRAYILQT